MPKILEDRRQAIARNNPNLSKSSTYAIATSALQKEGKMAKGGPVRTTALGGGMTQHKYCAGGKVISSRNY